jgi:hypothetical protein
MSNSKFQIKELTKKEYETTFSEKMNDITKIILDNEVIEIWDYVKLVDRTKCTINEYIIENELVEYVYRNSANTFDHVIIPTIKKNVYLIIIVDIINKNIYGHYSLNLNKEYSIKK